MLSRGGFVLSPSLPDAHLRPCSTHPISHSRTSDASALVRDPGANWIDLPESVCDHHLVPKPTNSSYSVHLPAAQAQKRTHTINHRHESNPCGLPHLAFPHQSYMRHLWGA